MSFERFVLASGRAGASIASGVLGACSWKRGGEPLRPSTDSTEDASVDRANVSVDKAVAPPDCDRGVCVRLREVPRSLRPALPPMAIFSMRERDPACSAAFADDAALSRGERWWSFIVEKRQGTSRVDAAWSCHTPRTAK
jgi:hypothetical protein